MANSPTNNNQEEEKDNRAKAPLTCFKSAEVERESVMTFTSNTQAKR